MARLGQHFLKDEHYLARIVEAADIQPGEKVLEIGPGTGLLTERLLSKGAQVVAIELDKGLTLQLKARLGEVPEDDFHLLHGDAAQVDWPRFDKLVSNLPYQISSPVLFRLMEEDYALAVLTVQKEFADRVVATPGTKDYSRLSVKAAVKAHRERLFTIPPGAFSPPPKVDSACIRLTPREPPDLVDRRVFDALLHQAFNHRRKMLRSSLRDQPQAGDVLDAMDLATLRPAKLSPDTWVQLANNVARARQRG